MEDDAESFNEERFSDLEQQAAGERLERWRNNPENWQESTVEEEEGEVTVSQPEKKKRKREEEVIDERELIIQSDKLDFFKSRVDDFKLFISRRIPPENPTAHEYLKKFMSGSYSSFASEPINKIAMLHMVGALNMVFGRMCTKCANDSFTPKTNTTSA